ncbi:MAG: TetR family transcriptional regulator, partial [Mycobacteriales bacterium]
AVTRGPSAPAMDASAQTPDQPQTAVPPELAPDELETARQARDRMISQRDELMTACTELAAQLAAEQEQVRQQRRRAEAAEQQMIRAAGRIEHLSLELTIAREQSKHWQAQAAAQRAEPARAQPEPTAVKTERTHSAQHLTDHKTRSCGRRTKLSPRQVTLARQMYDELDKDGKHRYTVQQIADAFGVTGPTIYRHFRRITSKKP